MVAVSPNAQLAPLSEVGSKQQAEAHGIDIKLRPVFKRAGGRFAPVCALFGPLVAQGGDSRIEWAIVEESLPSDVRQVALLWWWAGVSVWFG